MRSYLGPLSVRSGMSQIPSLRATSAGRLATALLAGLAAAWLIGACGPARAGTNAKQAVPDAVAHVATSTDTSPARTTTLTETQTVTEPGQTVTHTETIREPRTTSVAHTTTNVVVTPTSTTAEQASDQIPWWGWVLIGLGAAAVGVGLFALGHRHGARDQRST